MINVTSSTTMTEIYDKNHLMQIFLEGTKYALKLVCSIKEGEEGEVSPIKSDNVFAISYQLKNISL